jgi:tungstate transport system substrate-binding protein
MVCNRGKLDLGACRRIRSGFERLVLRLDYVRLYRRYTPILLASPSLPVTKPLALGPRTGFSDTRLVSLAIIALVLASCSKQPDTASDVLESPLRLATSSSAANSGLLDLLLPVFEMKHDVQVEVSAKGSGAALASAREGKADVVLVHAQTLENSFIANGFGLNRGAVMKNSFVIAGPPEDPVQIKACKGVLEALQRIQEEEAPFISRGDDSGTHMREKELWKLMDTVPTGDWYRQSNTGMADSLRMASQAGAYCLTDQGAFLSHHDSLRLVTVLQGDPLLHNPYSVIAVNPGKVPGVDFRKAMLLVDFLTGADAQEIIGGYGRIRFGRSLFTPVMMHR